MEVSQAYPNPALVAVRFNLMGACPLAVTWEVYSTAYRRMYSETVLLNGVRTVVWDLKDFKGSRVANGAYHVRFTAKELGTQVRSVMVLR